MSVENFKKEDLVGKSLERLLAEIESLSQDGTEKSYQTLEKFIVELSKVASDATLVVTKENGSKVMEIRGAQIDLTEKLKEIVTTIKNGIDQNAADKNQHAAREALRKTISGTVGVLLKEDEIMQELLSRGMTNEEFIKNAEEEIRRSQEKVDALKPLRDDKKAIMDSFGKTIYLETTKSYAQKSKLDELKHDKQALVLIKAVEDKLETLRKLKDGAATMDPTSQDYANNKAAMEELLRDVKGLAGDLKALGLRTSPVGASIDRKTQDIDFSYLEKLDTNSNFVTAKSTTKKIAYKANVDTNKTLEELIEEDYANIKAVMKANLAQFGFASDAEVDALTPDQVEKVIEGVKAEYTKYDEEIKYEEAYQAQTKESMEKFKTKADRKQELDGKFTTAKVKRKVKQPKLKTDGTPELGTDGEPLMEEVEKEVLVEVPTNDARKDYLAGQGIADEAAYKTAKLDAAKAAEEAAEASLSRETKRDLIRKSYQKDGEWHPIKWFRSQFFTNSMWENEYKNTYLSGKISTAQTAAEAAVDKEIKDKLEAATKKDLQDKKALAVEAEYVRKAFADSLKRAVSQEKMTDELYQGQTEGHVKEGARRAAMNMSLNVVSDAEMFMAIQREKRGEITKTELASITAEYNATTASRVKMDEKTHQDRAHADDIMNPTTSRKPQTPTYKDER